MSKNYNTDFNFCSLKYSKDIPVLILESLVFGFCLKMKQIVGWIYFRKWIKNDKRLGL